MELKKATRVGVRPLVGMFGESGSGKTMSALLLARGFVGDKGVIGMIDTESGRGSLYADVIPGGYDVLELDAPFAPNRHIEAIKAVEAHAEIGVLDSGSHEWEGIGGVCDMASQIEERTGKKGLHCWNQPKMEHNRFMLALLQSKIPWIVCLRAKHKSHQVKDSRGKTEIVKDDFTTAIQSDAFLFEMTVHMEIMTDNHHARITKCSHPALVDCFPKDGLITVNHGRLLRKWCDAPSDKPEKPEIPVKQQEQWQNIKELKKILWDITAKQHGGVVETLEQWLWDENYINPDSETLSSLTADRLTQVIDAIQNKGA